MLKQSESKEDEYKIFTQN